MIVILSTRNSVSSTSTQKRQSTKLAKLRIESTSNREKPTNVTYEFSPQTPKALTERDVNQLKNSNVEFWQKEQDGSTR